MMRWVKFAEIVLMGIAAAAYLTQNLYILFALMFLMGAQSAFFAPIKYGVLPQYMARDEMPAANGLIQGATFLAILLGQIFGAKLVLTDGGVLLVSIAVVAIAIIGCLPLASPRRVNLALSFSPLSASLRYYPSPCQRNCCW